MKPESQVDILTFCNSVHQAISFEFSDYQGNAGPILLVFSNKSNCTTSIEFKMWREYRETADCRSDDHCWVCSASFNEVVFSACFFQGMRGKDELSQFDMPFEKFNKVQIFVDGGRKACMERVIVGLL
jgi:hypothetical protein